MIHCYRPYKGHYYLITPIYLISIMKNITLVIILAIIAVAGITIYSQQKPKNDNQPENTMIENQSEAMMTQEDGEMMKTNNLMEKTNEAMMDSKTDTTMEKTSGSFIDYDNADIASLTGNIVLDFSAPWCPSCRAFEKNVLENINNIPSDLTIIKVDYDSNTELKAKYGVRMQHTFVQIDNTGEKIGLWTGGNDIQSVVSKLQ